jgi:hypothetical protein
LWLVCTLITWRWRNAGKRKILEIGVIISFIVFWITLSVVAEILLNPAQPLSSITPITPTATLAGSPTPNPLGNCYAWDAITSAQVGQNFCIYGKVSEFGGTVILFSRKNSQVRITYKPIGVYLRLQQGECIVAKGLITNENGVLMLTTSEISDCPPGFNP